MQAPRQDHDPGSTPDRPPQERLGALCVAAGLLTEEELAARLARQQRRAVPLGEMLVAEGRLDRRRLARLLAWQFRVPALVESPIEGCAAGIDRLGEALCLSEQIVPLASAGAVTPVATARPAAFDGLRPGLEALLGPVRMAVTTPEAANAAVIRLRRCRLARAALEAAPEEMGCRALAASRMGRLALAALLGLAALLLAWPLATMAALTGLALLVLVLNTGLVVAAALAPAPPPAPRPPRIARLPVVSLVVPLFREPEVAAALLDRLAALDYPRELMDVCLLVEEDDRATQAALDRAALPPWARQVRVPRGTVRTKPRALNYALPFCRGAILGIYDAEDAPPPDQLTRVVDRFHASPPDLACLQGVLDIYNCRDSWITRCFALDYACWFRVVLPGLAALGLVVPLGGTTVFFRRALLERAGAWDAYNVTEDADLGLRLARYGYRTGLIDSVTQEEAAASPGAWMRQRSRWLKGYAMTWAAHMRRPVQLWRALGPRRFLGMQILFLGALGGFALAPLLWLFWLGLAGVTLPWLALLPGAGLALPLLACSALMQAAVAICAVRRRGDPGLALWIPALWPYFALGTLAMARAMQELALRPFHWEKTTHGVTRAAPAEAVSGDTGEEEATKEAAEEEGTA